MLNLIVLSVRHRMEDNYELLGVYENKGMITNAVNEFLEEKEKAGISPTEYDFKEEECELNRNLELP
jgi:hypothetical protein